MAEDVAIPEAEIDNTDKDDVNDEYEDKDDMETRSKIASSECLEALGQVRLFCQQRNFWLHYAPGPQCH